MHIGIYSHIFAAIKVNITLCVFSPPEPPRLARTRCLVESSRYKIVNKNDIILIYVVKNDVWSCLVNLIKSSLY